MVIVLLTEKILWLQISMHDVLLVHVVKRQAKLFDHLRSLAFCEGLVLYDLIKKVTARNKLHNDVVISLVFYQLKNSCNVWVHSIF